LDSGKSPSLLANIHAGQTERDIKEGEGFRRMYTAIAINKGNYIGTSDTFFIPICTDVVICEQDVRYLIQKNYAPPKKVIKITRCWTEVRDVRIRVLYDRVFITGFAYQYKTLVGENNILFCDPIIDPFTITSSVKGLTPGMSVKWHVKNREYNKLLTPHLISYLNELTFHLQIILPKTLWVKTRAVIPQTNSFQ
jgi:hypothetical protein